MATYTAPATIDCQIMEFKHLCKIKTAHDVSKTIYKRPTYLIAVSSLYGLTFVGEYCNLKIIASNQVFEERSQNFDSKSILYDYLHRDISMPASPTHVDINSEQKLLSVAFCINETPVLRIYVIESFFCENVIILSEIKLSSVSGTYVTDLSWNPGISNILACCISDGTLSTYTFNEKGDLEVKSLPKESNSVCVCWSPKGKQIVVGNYNGFLTQYLPELKAVKNYPPPPNLFSKPCTLCSIKWLSNFQFIGVYKSQEQYLTEEEETKSCVVVVNTPKNGPITYVNYEDICFSCGTERPIQYYFIHIQTWNLIFVASSNAVEIAVLSLSEDNVTWVLWTLEDSARITLPMIKAEETYPVGVALDCSFPIQTPIGDKIVSMPVLSVLTNEGLICVYLINYMNPSVTSICVKANPLPSLKYFTTSSVVDESASKIEPSDTSLIHVDVRTSSQLPTCSYGVSNCTNSFEYARSHSEEVSYTVVSSSVPVLTYQTPAINTSSTANIVNVTSSSGMCTTKESTSELISVSANLSSQESVTRNVTTSDLSNTGIASLKNTEPQKLRNDLFKKLKKRVSVFENDIQEIKYLINNLEIDIGEKSTQDEYKLLTLENNSKKLKEHNAELHREIDELRPLIIEIFAYVQDVKSKYLQLQNPGYQLLSGIQDVDPVTKNNLETIEKTIDYIQSQVQKADKQLEEMWYKFSEDSFVITTKIPVLENVYETLMKQQKILSLLKRRTEKLEKNITNVACRLAKGQQQSNMSNINRHHLTNTMTADESALVQLTNRALNLYSSSDDHLNSRHLAQHFLKRHAKRFHLSYVKQVKLQELLSTGSVIYIQSSRLLRLKKKSLIVLSRSCTNENQETDERKAGKEEIVKTRMVSPVSSEDLDIFDRQTYVINNQSVVASTPLKSKQLSQSNINNVLTIEPSNNQLATTALNKITFSVPNTVSVVQVDPKIKQNDVKFSDPICITSDGETRLSVSKESNLSLEKSSVVSLNPPCSELGQTTYVPSTSSVLLNQNFTPVVTTEVIKTTNNFLENVKSSGTALPTAFSSLTVPFSNAGTSFLTMSLPARTSAGTTPLETATTRAIMATAITTPIAVTTSVAFSSVSMLMNNTADLKVTSCSSPFSFATPKSETLTATSSVSSANSASTSLFNLRPSVDSAFTSAAISSSLESGNAHFKSMSGTLSPSVGNCITVSSDASSSTETISLSKNVTVAPILNSLNTVYSNVVTTSPAVLSSVGSIFGKLSTPSATAINFGSILAPSSSISVNKAFAAVTPVMTTSTNELKEKNLVFNTFSFTRKPNDEVIKVSEANTETNANSGNVKKENAVACTTSSNISFSFANLTTALTFTPVKTLGTFCDAIPSLQSTTVTTVATPISVPLTNSSTLLNSHSATQGSTVPVSCSGSNISEFGKPVTSAIEGAAPVTTVSVSACTTSNSSTNFGTTESFFAGLNINSTTTAVSGSSLSKPATGGITAAPVFGSGVNNIFAFSTTVPEMTTTNNSKPIFGTGKSSFFSESGGAVVGKTESVFGSSSNVNVQGSRGSTFVSSPLFSSETNFVDSNAATVQPNSFGASSGNSLFGSGDIAFSTPSVSSPFQNTPSAGFGSPPTFSSGIQQQLANNSGGFGSPPMFSNVFNKHSSITAFGAAPTFGGSPTFGNSPTKMFGQSTSNLGPFGGAVNQSPTTFEALANENTVSFGNLAQQQPSGFGSPTFGNTNSSAFGVSSNFGGNAFSSWR